MEYLEKVRLNMSRLAERTEKFNVEFKRIVGDGETRGQWDILNETHQLAITALIRHQDEANLKKLKTVVGREIKVVEGCKDGLRYYVRALEDMGEELSKFFKVKSVARIQWYIRYCAILLEGIKKIRDRLDKEEKEIDVMQQYYTQHKIIDPFKMHEYKNMLIEERDSFRSMVDRDSVHKLSADAAFLSTLKGHVTQNSAKYIAFFFMDNLIPAPNQLPGESPGPEMAALGLILLIPGIAAGLVWSIIDPIVKLSLSMSVDAERVNVALQPIQ